MKATVAHPSPLFLNQYIDWPSSVPWLPSMAPHVKNTEIFVWVEEGFKMRKLFTVVALKHCMGGNTLSSSPEQSVHLVISRNLKLGGIDKCLGV